MTGGVLALNENPDQYEKLRNNPDLITSMVPEIIRWQTPLAYMRRTALEDTEIRGTENLKVLENIDVMLTVEVGRTEITIKDLLRLNEGSVVELDRLAGDPLDIMVNNTKIAKGEVVMVGERFGVRFGEIVDPEKRMESI